ncbi:MAG: Sulfate transporter family protein [Burkholderiaceae bacterium]|jgi:SulP family sulfate permease|nr:MAG: Sulfate transporter family protein [Burkholderiaceae bacterium]
MNARRWRLGRWFPFLDWPRPDLGTLNGELWAGITVGLMVIPQGVAYAGLAGMPLVTGIYASMLPALVAVLWSSSVRLSVGPTALSCLLVYSSLIDLAQPGSTEWVNLAVWLALLSGLAQVVLGCVRFGWLLNVVSSPVLMGFTQAAAILILASQVPALFGFRSGWSRMIAHPDLHWLAALFGLASLAALIVSRRFAPRFPAVVLVVLAASGLSALIGFEAGGGRVVGQLAAGLPALHIPSALPWATFGQLVVPVLVITLVSFLETASSAKVDSQRGGKRWNQDQDLIGQGLAKIASGLCGAFPTSSSFSRSALNLYAGAKTGWATIVSVAVVLLVLLFLTPVLRYVPQAVLGAVVVAATYGLLKPSAFARVWRVSRVEALIAAVTFAVTVLTAPNLYWGVIAGMLMSLSHFLYQRLHPRIVEVGLHPDGSLRERERWQLPPLAPRVYAVRMDAALDFASAADFERVLTEHLGNAPDTEHLCLFAGSINRIDATGVECFAQLRHTLAERDIVLHIAGMKLPVEIALQRSGDLGEGPLLRLYRTDAEALQAMREIAASTDSAPAVADANAEALRP